MSSASSPSLICMFHISLYFPPEARRSSCVPCSTTAPLSMTTIKSAWRTVLSLWATSKVVRPCAACKRSSITAASVSASRAEVASSHSKIGASFKMALAMATLCFSPPLSFRPLSPTRVSSPVSHDWTCFANLLDSKARCKSSSVAFGLPYLKLYLNEALNKTTS
mmetsp:Transcript_18520/g.24122  ORF Transcript_18520/g.24122 Transcript_18520/m.24122 type:complete len:165 (+) Transcript_18520:134-628(+)